MMTTSPNILKSPATTNGTANFLDGSREAAQTLAAAYLPVSGSQARGTGTGAAIAEVIGAAAEFTSAAASAATTGVNLTQYLSGYYSNPGNEDVPPALEIEITNNSSQPLVLFNYSANLAEVSKASQSLLPGESDIVLVTRSKAFSDQDTWVALLFLIGGNYVAVMYSWSNDSNTPLWSVGACINPTFTNGKIDPGQYHPFPANQQLCGATFVGDAGYSNFSFFTSNINTPSGQIDLDFLDYPSN